MCVSICLFFSPAIQAQYKGETFTDNGLEYTIVEVGDNGSCVEIAQFENFFERRLVIPAAVYHLGQSYPIVSVKEEGFLHSKITELDMSGAINLKSIGKSAFAESLNLREVIFPPFEQSNLTEIAPLAFGHCVSIHNFNLQDVPIEVLESLFTINENDKDAPEGLQELLLPSTLKEIKPYALQFLGLKRITFPSSITTIGDRVLAGNIYLKEFIWRDAQVTSIPRNFFKGDIALENVTILTVKPMEAGGLSDSHFLMCRPDLLTVTVSEASYDNLASSGYTTENSRYSSLVTDSTYVPSGIAAPNQHVAGSLHDGVIYTLQGIKVVQPRKGMLYIQNGKKFVK